MPTLFKLTAETAVEALRAIAASQAPPSDESAGRIAALEARVAELEEAVHELRGRAPPGIVTPEPELHMVQ